MPTPETLRVVFVVGFVLQIVVGAWAIINVTRLRRQQAIALSILNHLACRAGLQRDTDRLESGARPTAARDITIAPATVLEVLTATPPARARRGWIASLLDRRKS